MFSILAIIEITLLSLILQIPDVTCQQYVAEDGPAIKDCSKPDVGVCQNCGFPIPKSPEEKSNCWAQKNFTRYFASEYGPVSGAADMKKEIWKRGPIGKMFRAFKRIS